MGKGTDKLYITHSEWASEDAFSASVGSGVRQKGVSASFRRLPFNFCAISLQPFNHPVCTAEGVVFDLTNILPWLKKHGTNPVNGEPLKSSDLIKLNFAKNEEGEYVDPVTYKVFTDNTHIVALRTTGNVFAYDTVERLNIKGKMWKDLVTDQDFTRKDIIVIQDPQNLESRNLASFKYLKDGESTLTDEQLAERNDPIRNLNTSALGNSARILKAKQAVADARAKREAGESSKALTKTGSQTSSNFTGTNSATKQKKPPADNLAQWTSGKAAASFTSTGFTPHTAADRAVLSEEDYLLRPKRVKNIGYVRIETTHGPLTIELLPEFAPKAVWNFVQLARKGYYDGISFHRNIRSFMIQGGDPTGTGKGGASIWGKNFSDEFDGPRSHDTRGIVSMANKGKNTNGSQFFITYRQCKHLDRKHTIFGRVVEGQETLDRLEMVEVEETSKRPKAPVKMNEVSVLLDPFEEWKKEQGEKESKERDEAERKARGADDDKMTWTGKRIRNDGTIERQKPGASVGKYIGKAAAAAAGRGNDDEDEVIEEWEGDVVEEPVRKKTKSGGGFGNFDGW